MRTIHRSWLIAVVAAAASLLAGVSAHAGAPPGRWRGWTFQWENDAYAAFSGSDEHYTNGLRLSWWRNSELIDNPEWTGSFGEWWCSTTPLCGIKAEPTIGFGHAIGNNFYTPESITEPRLIVTDRPYAGYLYYSFLLSLRNDTARLPDDWEDNRPTENYFDLQVGFVGPEAGGEFLQSWAHEILEDDKPLGWDNQLEFEPTLELIYLWRRKIGGTRFDVIPHAGAGLGTIMTYGAVGGTVRWGRHLADFPVLSIPATATGTEIATLNVPEREYYLFVGAEGRGVAHNIFLDGNVFSDSHSVDKESFVYDLKAGFSYRYKSWRFTYTFTRRSREFSPNLDDDGGRHDYGSVALSWLAWPPG